MSGVSKAGFTIIETMLFLGITGLLIVGILAGTGQSINVQRYHDSVASLESQVQGLYSSVNDVVNSGSGSQTCPIAPDPSVPTNVGQSSCVVIGKYMTITGNSTATSTVIGYSSTAANDRTDSDLAILETYTLSLLPSSTITTPLDWNASIEWAKSGVDTKSPREPRTFSILILSSPATGYDYTFTADDTTTSLASMVAKGTTPQRTVCVDSGGIIGSDYSVVMDSNASTQNDIQVDTNDTVGATSQC